MFLTAFNHQRLMFLIVLTGREEVVSFPLRWSTVHSVKNPDHHPEEEEEEEEPSPLIYYFNSGVILAIQVFGSVSSLI